MTHTLSLTVANETRDVPLYRYVQGSLPVIINVPHAGTLIPDELEPRFTDAGNSLSDTDWHVDQLMRFAAGDEGMGVHMLSASCSRSLVDLNRDPDGAELYPGQFNSSICPTQLFDERPVYKDGQEPTSEEVDERIMHYWHPYHARLQALINELRDQYGRVVLFDAHSIRSHVPSLFEGELPDLNIGTDDGRTLPKELEQSLYDVAEKSRYSAVLNGRFKGGYITRHYANPSQGVHTVQLEIAQKNYMEEKLPFNYLELRAAKLQKVLGDMLNVIIDWTK